MNIMQPSHFSGGASVLKCLVRCSDLQGPVLLLFKIGVEFSLDMVERGVLKFINFFNGTQIKTINWRLRCVTRKQANKMTTMRWRKGTLRATVLEMVKFWPISHDKPRNDWSLWLHKQFYWREKWDTLLKIIFIPLRLDAPHECIFQGDIFKLLLS